MWETEVRILKKLKHRNILEFIDAFEESGEFFILTGMCRGGELFDRVKDGSFSEKAASALTRQMLEAIAHCHDLGIVHRDLKPENFVFETPAADSNMKLIDFGCAKEVRDDEIVRDYAGSPYYVAPEVLRDVRRDGKMWKCSDMWSVGVIVFLLVTGYPPFNGFDQDQIFRAIRTGRFTFPPASEIPLSDSVKDLITRLLVIDPSKRLTAHEALQHPWVAGLTATTTPLPLSVAKNLTAFQGQCRLRKAVARALAQRMTDEDKLRLGTVFQQFDANGDGQLGPDEIAAMMKHLGGNIDAKEFFAKMDEDGSGTISQEEFATANALGQLATSSTEEIKRNFKLFDADGDGFVTMQEIEKLCGAMSPEQAKGLIGEVDQNGDGKINFDEWLAAMTQRQQSAKPLPGI